MFRATLSFNFPYTADVDFVLFLTDKIPSIKESAFKKYNL